MSDQSIRHGRGPGDGIELAYLACGREGPLAMCLHGFPDTPWTWRHLLPELAAAGYRAVAPYLRGYAPSDLDPRGRYQNGAEVADVVALYGALEGDSASVVIGHDWGARIATGAAAYAPERWSKLVTMSVPPSGVAAMALTDYDQLKRSFYTFLFQTPLAELIVPMNNMAFIDRLWEDWSPGYDASEDLPRVKEALGAPGHLEAAIGYYRATLGGVGLAPEYEAHEAAINQTPPQPHLYLHGTNDGCMGIDVSRGAAAVLTVPGSRMVEVDDAGHFLHLEQPERVNQLVLEFLTG